MLPTLSVCFAFAAATNCASSGCCALKSDSSTASHFAVSSSLSDDCATSACSLAGHGGNRASASSPVAMIAAQSVAPLGCGSASVFTTMVWHSASAFDTNSDFVSPLVAGVVLADCDACVVAWLVVSPAGDLDPDELHAARTHAPSAMATRLTTERDRIDTAPPVARPGRARRKGSSC